MNYNNHLSVGKRTLTFKQKKVVTSLNSKDFRSSLESILSRPRRVGIIPPGFEHRADLIAELFYGSPTLDWVVLWVNKISDPFQQLNSGDRITIVDLI